MIFGRAKNSIAETPYSFQDRFASIQKIAIIYPQDVKWLRIANYTLQRLFLKPELFEYMLLYPGAHVRPEVPARHEFWEMKYQPNPAEFEALLSRIHGFAPQLLFQLDPESHSGFRALLTQLNVPIKAGFGNEKSGLNIVFSEKRKGFYEKSILSLIEMLTRLEV